MTKKSKVDGCQFLLYVAAMLSIVACFSSSSCPTMSVDRAAGTVVEKNKSKRQKKTTDIRKKERKKEREREKEIERKERLVAGVRYLGLCWRAKRERERERESEERASLQLRTAVMELY